MVCRTTSITRRIHRGTAGSSLIENWVAICIFSVILAVVMSFSLYTGKSFAGLSNYVDLEQRSQMALDRMTQDIRQTQYLTSISSNKLVFQDSDGSPLTYSYSPGARTLTRTKGVTIQTLLTECDYLSFSKLSADSHSEQWRSISDHDFPHQLQAGERDLDLFSPDHRHQTQHRERSNCEDRHPQTIGI